MNVIKNFIIGLQRVMITMSVRIASILLYSTMDDQYMQIVYTLLSSTRLNKPDIHTSLTANPTDHGYSLVHKSVR
jgi:hypothetical protein